MIGSVLVLAANVLLFFLIGGAVGIFLRKKGFIVKEKYKLLKKIIACGVVAFILLDFVASGLQGAFLNNVPYVFYLWGFFMGCENTYYPLYVIFSPRSYK